MAIDFHSHILPGIDDGSRNEDMSLIMLERSASAGVETMVATPHFYAQRDSVGHFLERREKSIERLAGRTAQRTDLPGVCVGAEVYYFSGMGKAAELPKLCILGTNLVLIEMPFDQWDKSVIRDIRMAMDKQSLKVGVVHVERYYPFQKDKSAWNELLQMPVYLQINAGSLLSFRGRRFAADLVKEHTLLLGSDCHNPDRRPPNLDQGRKIFEKKFGSERLGASDALAEKLLAGAVKITACRRRVI